MKKKLTVNTLALGNLRTRKKQYASLITGIILAMVFSSSVLLMFSSMAASVYQQEKDRIGNQNGIYIDAGKKMFADAAGKKLVGDYAFARVVGEAFTRRGVSYPVAAYDEKAARLANIKFIEGGYPRSENEIAVEESTLAKLCPGAKAGDSITIKFAVQNGKDYLPDITEKTYVLSGIASNKASFISGVSSYANTVPSVFVAGDTQVEPGGREMLVCYFNYYEQGTFSNTNNYLSFIEFLEESGLDTAGFIPADSSSFVINNPDNGVYNAGMFIILFVCVLLAASCLGIVNAFSSNLNERRRQIGMLRTVGASKRQIIIIYGREAFIISLICAPLSAALSCLIVKAGLMLLGEDFVFSADIWVIALCIVTGVICVMLAALIPLIKAAGVTPVQTVRNINVTRRAARSRIKSQKAFSPPALIAKRSLFFYGRARAAAGIILVLTITGSCWGFSALEDMKDFDWLPQYEYEMSYYGDDMALINTPAGEKGYEYSDYIRVRDIPYADDVNISQYCKAFMVSDEFSEYQKTVLYANASMSAIDDISGFISRATQENIDGYMQSAYTPSYSALKNYCGSGEILPVTVAALDSSVLEKLNGSVESGEIDFAALDSGREVIAVMPREIAFYAQLIDPDDANGGYTWGADTNDNVKSGFEYLKSAECDIDAGQEIKINVVSGGSDELFRNDPGYYGNIENDIYTGNLQKKDCTVKIGSVIYEMPDGFYSECTGLSGNYIVFLTSLEGMKNFYDSDYYSNINFNLNTECTDEIDSEITDELQNIVDSIDGASDTYISYYSFVSGETLRNTALLVSLAAVLILFLSISASIINNSLTAQIREGRREIGTLRAVGASVRELFGAYSRQLVSLLGASCAAGFALFFVSYFIARAAFSYSEIEWFFSFSIRQTAAACALLFAFCCANIWLKIKKEMKHSVIDNIREL